MERPALKRLLVDIAAGKIDVIVVYKIDRLTRSLADFARMVELFDQHEVSFVSVTQAFNTTSAQNWELKMNPQTPFSHGTRVSCMVAKGQFLFSGGGMFPNEPATPDNAIRVWQLQPQTQQFAVAKTMNGHESSIKSMALTSDGAWLVSGDMSGTICTWSSANGNPGNMTRQAHTGNMPFVMSVLPFSGNTLLTASYVHHGNLVCGFCVWTSSFPNSDQRIFSFRNMFCISLLLYYVPSYAPPPPLSLFSSSPPLPSKQVWHRRGQSVAA